MNAKDQINNLLNAYEKALNASDVGAVLELYTEDGVFMPTEAPTASGLKEVEVAYRHVFNTIQLKIKFEIDEIEVEEKMAFARTMSRGEVTVLAAGITQPEENRELFVLKQINGSWKIARYMFNKTKPATAE